MGMLPWSSAPAMRVPSSSFLALKQTGQTKYRPPAASYRFARSASGGQPVAGDSDRRAVDAETHGFLGEEHEGLAAGLGGADGDEVGDGDLLGVLEAGGQGDDCFVRHDSSSRVTTC